PGGADNTVVHVQSLGGRATLLSVVGDDSEGDLLRDSLQRHGVDTANVLVQPGRRTLSKQRILAGSQVLLRLDEGSTEPLDDAGEEQFICRLAAAFAEVDAVIVSDYRYGAVTPRVIRALA